MCILNSIKEKYILKYFAITSELKVYIRVIYIM